MKYPANVTLVNVQCINGMWRNLCNFIQFLQSVYERMPAFVFLIYPQLITR